MEAGERVAAGADLQRQHEGEQAEHQRQGEEQQRGDPVGGEQPVEDLRPDQRVVRDAELQAHHHQLGEGGAAKKSAVAMYMRPTALWSALVTS